MTTYILKANGERLVAESLDELADLLNAATAAGHDAEWTRAVDKELGLRRLTDEEFGQMLARAAKRARAPRKCEVYSLGFLIAMRWTPRLGLGRGERRRRWPRRWTFALGQEWIGFSGPNG